MRDIHNFFIPVMGTGFTLDTPIKVAKYGISSVISLVDDTLIERARQFYCRKIGEEYIAITKNDEDCRAKRITAYLDLVNKIVKDQFTHLKASAFEAGSEIAKYFELLPEESHLKSLYQKMLAAKDGVVKTTLQDELRAKMRMGRIDVNIMTKLNRLYYSKDKKELPLEFADAMAALRGYAQSTCESAIVFSAGFNRHLYSYVENFNDFSADAKGYIKKKIILKVSDYRSALTQGKFFAKKGLWVSEYRIESGLNCGGHVFPSAGELMGPILEEFKTKKQELLSGLHAMYNSSRRLKKMPLAPNPPETQITFQGGIGTYKEHDFISRFYHMDQIGWATPFLLCPETTNVDEVTLKKLLEAKEEDLYTSDVSPIGAPFNNLRGSLSEREKEQRIKQNNPGSPCPKSHLTFNSEFTRLPLCVASHQYQKLRIKNLENQRLTRQQFERSIKETLQKSCLCHDLGGSFLLKNNLLEPGQKAFPAICPGPNLAYFSRISSLRELADHIYGRNNILESIDRPHVFLKEIEVNIDFLEKEIKKCLPWPDLKDIGYFLQFWRNLLDGIHYYQKLLSEVSEGSKECRKGLDLALKVLKDRLDEIISQANLTVKLNIRQKLQALRDNIKEKVDKKSRGS
ncbi:MAG: hypothetical protein ABIJ41_07375 [Candidatus Omnitrophota bacterium]